MITIPFNYRYLNLVVLFVLTTFTLKAQNPQINFKHYTINDGLSQNTVFCLLEDRDGVIWIGTEDGLNKFNGYEFTCYKHSSSNANSLLHNQVNALYEDKKGNIWIGTSDGLNVFDKKTEIFTPVNTVRNNLNSNDIITSIFEDKKGNIWITGTDGLKSYQPEKNKFQHHPYLGAKRADKIFEDRDGIFWVSIDRDLRRFDPKKKQFLSLPSILENDAMLRKSYIRTIKEDSYQKIWIGTETAGLFVYDKGNNSLQNFRSDKSKKSNLPIDIVRDVYFPNKSEVLVGTRDGLRVFNRATQKFNTYRNEKYNPKSLSQNSVRTILKDKAGNIWLGTFSGGINLITNGNNMFKYLGAESPGKPGLSYQMVGAIAGARNGGYWIGTEGGGLNFSNSDFSIFKHYNLPGIKTKIGANTIKALLPEGDNLWIGTVDGLYFFNGANAHIESIFLPIENRELASIFKIKDELWIATNGSGLVLRDKNGKMTIFRNNSADSNSLSQNRISKIISDKQDNLWIATSRGLNYFDRKKFKQFDFKRNDAFSISNSDVSSLFIDSKNRIWVGTNGGGLNFFDHLTSKFYAINENLGLGNDVIQSIEEDNHGNLWVSTNKGLSKIAIKGVAPFTKSTVSISNYIVEDGLQSNQFMGNSSFKNEKGELFFGGINGITYFNPADIKRNPFVPNIILTEFLIRNAPISQFDENSVLQQSINETKRITLAYDQAFISFRFAALNYINPAKNQYAYKLEGFNNDDDWHFVGNQRLATYTNLEVGTYVFKVKAANNDGIWNNSPKTIEIIVLPPWWKTWWAYTIYTLIISALLYLYYAYSLRTIKLKKDLEFEHVIREKENELYQRKLNLFTNISHEIKTPLTLILAPLEKILKLNQGNNMIQQQLMVMNRNGERLMRLINQLLDFRKFESGKMELQVAEGNIVGFINEVVVAFENYAQYLNIKIEIESTKPDIKLWFDRDKFEKILYNLLSNALKFTKAGGKVVIRVSETKAASSEEPGYLLVEVEDDGLGISEDKISKIFDSFRHYEEAGLNMQGTGIGLAFTKGLVELHHGCIEVNSTVETDLQKGYTCFTIKVPMGKDHFNENEISSPYLDDEQIENYLLLDQEVNLEESLQKKAANVLSGFDEKPIMLIVEDNKEVLNFVKEHFEDTFQIHTAIDGQQGVEKGIELLPDVIISDVMMPKMSGVLLCSTLKKDNRTSHIPIVLLTARTQVANKIEGLETGADDYITKPFNISILEVRVWNLLEQRQVLRERYRKEITLQPQNLAITSPDEVFLGKVMAYIEANISEPGLNVEDLAKEVFMGRTTLYRKIKALTNQTTVDFIRTVRLKRAAQLLKSNSYSINEIAYMTGFNDIDYFRKCFKSQFNLTPTEYIHSIKG